MEVGESVRDELMNSFLGRQYLHLTVKEAELPWSQTELGFGRHRCLHSLPDLYRVR